MFEPHIIVFFEEAEKLNDLERIKQISLKHEERFISKTVSKFPLPDRLLGDNGLMFIQRTLFRSRVILEGVIDSLNSKNTLMALLGVRAHFEITGTLAYFYKRLISFYSGNITYENLDKYLYRLSMGGRVKENPKMPDPIGVMDLIDSIDDYYRKISGNKDKMFRISYDDLSEYCHPNCFGLFLASDIDSKKREVNYKKTKDISHKNYWYVSLFLMSIETIIYLYDRIYELLEKHEVLPKIIR